MPQNDKIKIKRSDIEDMYDIEDDVKEEVKDVHEEKDSEFEVFIKDSDEKLKKETGWFE